MKKTYLIGITALCGAIAVPAFAQDSEIGYPEGALAYQALMNEDYASAARTLEEDPALADDPARLINLGQAYARLGRTGDAEDMFQAAIDSKTSFDVVMSDGSVMSTRQAARRALANLERRIAIR